MRRMSITEYTASVCRQARHGSFEETLAQKVSVNPLFGAAPLSREEVGVGGTVPARRKARCVSR